MRFNMIHLVIHEVAFDISHLDIEKLGQVFRDEFLPLALHQSRLDRYSRFEKLLKRYFVLVIFANIKNIVSRNCRVSACHSKLSLSKNDIWYTYVGYHLTSQ